MNRLKCLFQKKGIRAIPNLFVMSQGSALGTLANVKPWQWGIFFQFFLSIFFQMNQVPNEFSKHAQFSETSQGSLGHRQPISPTNTIKRETVTPKRSIEVGGTVIGQFRLAQ